MNRDRQLRQHERLSLRAEFGRFLKTLRLRHRLSQKDVADLISALRPIPLTRQEIARYERGARLPTRYVLSWYAVIFDLPLIVLLTRRRGTTDAHGVGYARMIPTDAILKLYDTMQRWHCQHGHRIDTLNDQQVDELRAVVRDILASYIRRASRS